MTEAVLAQAQAAIAKGSKSFALASRLFDPHTRAQATLLYAWCRHCDDVIDGQYLGEGAHEWAAWGETPQARLATLRDLSHRAIAGEPMSEPAFAALALVAAQSGLPVRYADDLLHGFAMDVHWQIVRSSDDLLTYCYHVAGCVGVMMAIVMGVAPDNHAVLARASDLGLSFQLNNIARDVLEDAERGRCYLPLDWLQAEGLALDTYARPENRAALHRVVTRLVDLAERYEASALHGVPALGVRSGWAVLSAAKIYGDIGRKVRAKGPAALEGRIFTGKAQKLLSVLCAWPDSWWKNRIGVSGSAGREGLWTPSF